MNFVRYGVFWCINVGGLSPIATTELELNIGFWAAYLLPLRIFVVGLIVLLLGRRYYIVRPPSGSVVAYAFKALWIGLRNQGNMEAAKSSYQQRFGNKYNLAWDDLFVEELRRMQDIPVCCRCSCCDLILGCC